MQCQASMPNVAVKWGSSASSAPRAMVVPAPFRAYKTHPSPTADLHLASAVNRKPPPPGPYAHVELCHGQDLVLMHGGGILLCASSSAFAHHAPPPPCLISHTLLPTGEKWP